MTGLVSCTNSMTYTSPNLIDYEIVDDSRTLILADYYFPENSC